VALRAIDRTLARILAGALAVAVSLAQPLGDTRSRVSLERANARHRSDFSPALEGQSVTVAGVASAKPIAYRSYSRLAIQDSVGAGLILEGTPEHFDSIRPGSRVEARGTVSNRAGLPVLAVSRIQVLSQGSAPAPKRVDLDGLRSFRNLGVLVTTEGRVVDKGENSLGEYLLIGEVNKRLSVVSPAGPASGPAAGLDRFEIGDRIRVTGIASQYCPLAPYNRSFQLVVAGVDSVVPVGKRWMVSPQWFAVLLAFLAFALGLWWIRERKMRAQRDMVRAFYSLGEEVIGIPSPLEVLQRLAAVLPRVLNVSGVHLYLYNRSSKMLDRVGSGADGAPVSVAVQSPEGSLPLGPAVCYRNQALLTIPRTHVSPFFPDGRPGRVPGSVMFVPMFAETEVLGVLEVFDWKPEHDFKLDERVLTQHLGNQIGIALRLTEEKTVREQLFRSEKLAAVGQLISGIAAELRSPLESISNLAEHIVTAPVARWEDFQTISTEAHKASEIVARLVSFMQPERGEAKRVELNGLIGNLIEFRRQEWQSRGFEIRTILSPSPLYVLGSQGQLERVFLDLLVQAEHALSESAERRLIIATSMLAHHALVEIEYTTSASKASWDALPGADLGLHVDGVARGIVRSHGGELRMTRSAQGDFRLEIEFPAAPARAAEEGGAVRAFTCLVVEPDGTAREELVRMMTQRGCRVIPATSAEAGAELVQRLRFDIVFCAVRLPGLNWIEFSEGIRSEVGAFVLLTEGFDFELSRGLLSAESYVLTKPVIEPELDQVLAAVESRAATAESRVLVMRPPDKKAAGNTY
jgi:CheY-like chemotaxis protein